MCQEHFEPDRLTSTFSAFSSRHFRPRKRSWGHNALLTCETTIAGYTTWRIEQPKLLVGFPHSTAQQSRHAVFFLESREEPSSVRLRLQENPRGGQANRVRGERRGASCRNVSCSLYCYVCIACAVRTYCNLHS